MTTSEDIEKAIDSYEEQKETALFERDAAQCLLDACERRLQWIRDQIQGLRKMEIERESK